MVRRPEEVLDPGHVGSTSLMRPMMNLVQTTSMALFRFSSVSPPQLIGYLASHPVVIDGARLCVLLQLVA